MRILLFTSLAFLITCGAIPAATADAAPGFRGEFLKQLDDLEKKCVSLAETVPEAKYSWRPADGVRSIGEVFVHIAGANYMFTRFIGAKMPAGLNPNEKTVTKKADVVELLKKSFSHAREAVKNMPDADLEKEVKMFGNTVTERQALFVMANHAHEHLGQSIAYARTNGVVPPWSEK
jgi:uncharacterized damage-inducible protein DinB